MTRARVGQPCPEEFQICFIGKWANNNYTSEEKEALCKSSLARLAQGHATPAKGGYQAIQ